MAKQISALRDINNKYIIRNYKQCNMYTVIGRIFHWKSQILRAYSDTIVDYFSYGRGHVDKKPDK